MKITCEHTFCIYQKKGKCLLDAIEVSESGLCRSCIAAPVDEDELALQKARLRMLYERMDAVKVKF